MGKGRSPWQDGRRAWARLNGWHRDGSSVPAGARTHPDDGDQALDALGDVGLVRRLLDQAELVAVRTARRHGKSWAEIATRLGVTRQSAWERWRDLDAAVHTVSEAVPDALPEPPSSEVPAEVLERTAREMRRRSSVRVPNVVGLQWAEARDVLLRIGLRCVGSDPDEPPVDASTRLTGVVTDQSPESGAKVPPGTQVRLWIGRGGSGVREPRRPRPVPRAGRAMRDDPADADERSDDAVG